jgi:hypothetical protein
MDLRTLKIFGFRADIRQGATRGDQARNLWEGIEHSFYILTDDAEIAKFDMIRTASL